MNSAAYTSPLDAHLMKMNAQYGANFVFGNNAEASTSIEE